MRKLKIPFTLALLMFLAACGTLGVPAPQTFNERALATVASLNGASRLAVDLLRAKKISPNEFDSIANRLDSVQEAIDIGVRMYGDDPQGGEDHLSAAIRALDFITKELEQRKE